MFIAVRADMKPAIEMIQSFERLGKVAFGRRGKEIMAEILEFEHKRAFDHGGWAFKGGDDWMPTSPYWVAHLYNKQGNKPLVWTGHGQESIRGVVNNKGVSVHGAKYLGKFQFGPFQFTETFPVAYDVGGMEWVKVPSDFGQEDTMTKRIKVQEREVFAFFHEDVEQWLFEVEREARFALSA